MWALKLTPRSKIITKEISRRLLFNDDLWSDNANWCVIKKQI